MWWLLFPVKNVMGGVYNGLGINASNSFAPAAVVVALGLAAVVALLGVAVVTSAALVHALP